MGKGWWAKLLLLLFFVGLSVVYVYPTVAKIDPETSKFPFKQKINLGLDLQGGLYMVMGVDFNRVFKDAMDRQANSLRDSLKDRGIPFKSVTAGVAGTEADDPRIAMEFDPAQKDKVYDFLKKEMWTLRLAAESEGRYELGLSTEFRAEVRDRTINQSIEVIRNRIDEFGVAEPSIASQGNDRVVVELPGVKEIERAKELIGRTAKLEFKIADDESMAPDQIVSLIETIEKEQGLRFKEGERFSTYVQKLNEHAKGKIPAGTEIAFERISGMEVAENDGRGRIPYLLRSKVEVEGADLDDAHVAFDQETQRPNVSFTLNPKGASLFDKLTGDNIGKRLAIVLDGIVHSAPVIQGRISGGRGQITLGQGDRDKLMREAKDLAIVLRAGALPAQLEFLEQRVIGPSLGQDSIRKGAIAAVVGSILVFLFIMIYYRLSGVIATFSLVLNVLFILACLVGLEATLTLPGIAGIALTVGMAVDSNVIIYERIRDELREGKKLQGAVEAGFQKAFRSIIDANLTTAAAAVVLLIYGTGPIRGFAVTLLIGIATTLFCAVFVCRVIFEWLLQRLENRGAGALSI